jgi:hypothetical protein
MAAHLARDAVLRVLLATMLKQILPQCAQDFRCGVWM